MLKNSYKNITSKFYWIVSIIIVGAQQFMIPLVPYILIIFLSLPKIGNFLTKKIYLIIIIFLSVAFLNLLLNGYTFIDAIKVFRFFLGLTIIYLFISPNLILKIRYPIVVSFIIWNFLELIFTYIIGSPPFYITNYMVNEGYSYDFINLRLLGPCLNSSINGSLAACILIASIFNKEIIFVNYSISKFQQNLVSISVGLIFIFSASGTAYGVISFLIINKYIWPKLLVIFSTFRIKKSFIALLALIFSSILIFFVSLPILFNKLDPAYISFIYQLKYSQIYEFFESSNLKNILLGRYFENDYGLFSYGDFIILGFINSFGILFLITYMFILNKIFSFQKVYFFSLLLSSIHYGTLFAVTGQIISCIIFTTKKKRISFKDSL